MSPLLVVASGGFSAGNFVSAVVKYHGVGRRRGCTGRPQPGRGKTMSRQYYVSVSLRRRLIVAGFFGLCVYETASAHDWGPMVVFLIPAALAS